MAHFGSLSNELHQKCLQIIHHVMNIFAALLFQFQSLWCSGVLLKALCDLNFSKNTGDLESIFFCEGNLNLNFPSVKLWFELQKNQRWPWRSWHLFHYLGDQLLVLHVWVKNSWRIVWKSGRRSPLVWWSKTKTLGKRCKF